MVLGRLSGCRVTATVPDFHKETLEQLLSAGYKNHVSMAHFPFPSFLLISRSSGCSRGSPPSSWPWQRTFKQLLGLDEAPALGNSSWSSFWVQRAEAKQADRMCTNPVSSPTPPTTGALWRGREKLFGEESELYKGHCGPSPQLVHAQLKHVPSWSYMSNAHIHNQKIWPTLSAASFLFLVFLRIFHILSLLCIDLPSIKKKKLSCPLLQTRQLKVTSYISQISPSSCTQVAILPCVPQSCSSPGVRIMSMQQQEQGRSHSGTKQTKPHQGPLREVFQHRHPKNCHSLAQASGPCRPDHHFNVWCLQMTQEEQRKILSETTDQTVSKESFILTSFCWKFVYHPIHTNLFFKSLLVHFW